MSDEHGDRLTPTGDDARALRHMVRELTELPAPKLDWERLEARLFERIDGAGESPARQAAARAGDESISEVPVSVRPTGAASGSHRVQRRVRGRWLGAWAAVAAVLVAGAAFAWVERMGQVAPPPASSSAPEAGEPVATPPRADVERGITAAPPLAEEPASPEVDAPVEASPRARVSPAPIEAAPPPSPEPANEVLPPPVGSPAVTSERELTQRLLRCIEERRAAEAASGQREGVEAVVVEIRSQLVLRVGAEGAVEGAIFQPPLRPELQGCAVSALRSQLAPGEREVRIPIVLR